MLIIKYGHYTEKIYKETFNIVRKCLPDNIKYILSLAEKNHINIIIDVSPRKTLEEKSIDADAYSCAGFYNEVTSGLYLLGPKNLISAGLKAGRKANPVINISTADDLTPGQYAGALIHELTVHTAQFMPVLKQLSFALSVTSFLRSFSETWEERTTNGGGGKLDGDLHHIQMLDQSKGLGKQYHQSILNYKNYCKTQMDKADQANNDPLAMEWEERMQDVSEQYQDCLKKESQRILKKTITFVGDLKIAPKEKKETLEF